MAAISEGGWVIVPCDAPDTAQVYISVGGDFLPAFRAWHNGQRVAQVRRGTVGGVIRVVLRVDGDDTDAGMVA